MFILQRSLPKGIIPFISFILWTILFATAYCQSPLFTSNQNQYFLHGMARAGFGFLDQDWLANTADPTPVFSALVEWTHRLFHWEPMYYGYYALLMGIYVLSLFGIVSYLFKIDKSTTISLFFLAIFFLFHSAGMRFTLSRVIGVNWTYILEDGVADQRMLGPVFQPSSFGVLLVLSIYFFLMQRYYPAIISACLAAIFHPTYLLSAAVLILAFMEIIFRETHQVKLPIRLGLLALILVSPIVYQSFSIFGGTNANIAEESRQILINFRIPHHALVNQWLDATAWLKILIIIMALIVMRKTRYFMILMIPFGISLILTITQVITQNSALALMFPWRVSIFLVPVSVSILLAKFGSRFIDWLTIRKHVSKKWITVTSILLILMTVISGAVRLSLDLMRKNTIPERALFTYVFDTKQAGDLYLTPSKMQDFRLETGAPVFVEFKSIPYKDTDVLEWYRRVSINNQFYKDYDCDLVSSLVEDDGITHIITPQGASFAGCSILSIQYQDDNYKIFIVNQ